MSGLRIRPATPADAATIVAHNLAMAWETERLRLDEARLAAGVAGLFADPRRGFYRIAERGGAPVGQAMVTYEWSDWRAADFWWIQSVYVRREARRQGIYRALYEHLLAESVAQPGVCGLRLYVHEDNARARAVYTALGMPESHYRLHELD